MARAAAGRALASAVARAASVLTERVAPPASAASTPTSAARSAATMRPAAARTSVEAASAPDEPTLLTIVSSAGLPVAMASENPAGISNPAAARPSATQGSKSDALLGTTRTTSDCCRRRHQLLRLRPAVRVVQRQRQAVATAAEQQPEEGRECRAA